MAEDRGDVAADEFGDRPGAFGLRQAEQLPGQRAAHVAARGGGPPDGGADQPAPDRGEQAGHRTLPQCHGVDPGGHGRRAAQGAGGVEERQALGDRERDGALAGQPDQVAVVQRSGRAALGLPGAPGDGQRGQPPRGPVLCERVQEAAGRGEVGVPGAADDAGRRGEQHERGERYVQGEFVQPDRAGDPGAQHLGEPVPGERGQHAAVGDPGRVHHGGQRVLGGHGRQQAGQRSRIGDVARGGGDLDAQFGQLGPQFGHTRDVRTAPADQQQVLDAVHHGQVPGECPAQRAGAAGDQHRARRVEFRPGGLGRGVARGEPGNPHHPVAYGELRLGPGGGPSEQIGVRGGRGGRRFGGLGVGVEQDEAVGVFGLRGADEPPDDGGGEVVEGGAGFGGDGSTRGHDEGAVGETVVGQPRLYVGQ